MHGIHERPARSIILVCRKLFALPFFHADARNAPLPATPTEYPVLAAPIVASESSSSFAAASSGFPAATDGSSERTAAPISTRRVPPYRGRRAGRNGAATAASTTLIAARYRNNRSPCAPSAGSPSAPFPIFRNPQRQYRPWKFQRRSSFRLMALSIRRLDLSSGCVQSPVPVTSTYQPDRMSPAVIGAMSSPVSRKCSRRFSQTTRKSTRQLGQDRGRT